MTVKNAVELADVFAMFVMALAKLKASRHIRRVIIQSASALTPTPHLRFFRPNNCLPAFNRVINRNLDHRVSHLYCQPNLLRPLQSRERVFGLPVNFQAEPLKRRFALSSNNVWRGFFGGLP